MGLIHEPTTAVLVFNEDREIVDLGGEADSVWQAPEITVSSLGKITPGVKAMDAGYGCLRAAKLISAGRPDGHGVFARLQPESGFPFVLMGDLSMLNKGPGGAQFNPGFVRIYKTWRRVPRFPRPIILPPKAGYLVGGAIGDMAYAILPIGGWISDADHDYMTWLAGLEVDPDPNLAEPMPEMGGFRFSTGAQLLTAGADLILYSPAFPVIVSSGPGGDNADVGDVGVGAVSAMAQITTEMQPLMYHCGGVMADTITTGEVSATKGSGDGDAATASAAWFRFKVTANWTSDNATVQGDLPEYSNVRGRW